MFFRKNHQFPIVAFAEALCPYTAFIFQVYMNDSTVVGVHLPYGYRLFRSFGFFGHPGCHRLEIAFALIEIALNINQHPDPVGAFFIDHFFQKVLNGFKSLTPFTNQNTAVATGN